MSNERKALVYTFYVVVFLVGLYGLVWLLLSALKAWPWLALVYLVGFVYGLCYMAVSGVQGK